MYTMAKIANLAEKERQMAGENLNGYKKRFLQSGEVDKIRHGFGKYSNWMRKVASWRAAIMTKIVKAVSNGKKSPKGWQKV